MTILKAPSPEPPHGPSHLTLLGRLAGAIGSVLLLSVPLTYVLADWGPLLVAKLVAGFVCLALYLATNRDFFTRSRDARATSLMVLSLASAMLVFLGVAFINYQIALHPKELDCTREKLYTLGPQTLATLAGLKDPVSILAFYRSEEEPFGLVSATLNRYQQHSDKLTVQMVNPLSRPDLVKKYSITEKSARIVVVGAGKDTRAKSIDEEDLTNAILRAVQKGHISVTFLTGHGEGDIKETSEAEGYAAFAHAIEADGYAIDTLNLLQSLPEDGNDAPGTPKSLVTQQPQQIEVPSSVSVLLVLAPQHKLLQPELAALERYIDRGGRLLVFEEAQVESGLKDLLRQWHIEVRDDLIVDTNPVGRLLGLGVASPMVMPTQAAHPITRGLAGMVMKTARSLQVGTMGHGGVVAVPLAETGESSWGETQLKQGGTIARDDADHLPPLYVAIAAHNPQGESVAQNDDKEPTTKRSGRLVVFGDSDWVSNGLFSLQSNEDLALNALGWLVDEADKVTIRPRTRGHSQLSMSGEDLGKLKFFSMDIVPVMLIALGMGIVVIRRQR